MAGKAKILTTEEITNVFKILETSRDRVIFGVGIFTGMRIGEIISLTQNQVFTDEGVRNQITVRRLKKRDAVYSDIPIHTKLRKLLAEYKKDVRQNHWLFPSNESVSGHLSRDRADKILRTAFKTLKLEGAKTHSMRRSCLTALSRSGVVLRTIQEISGHSNLGQLQQYLDIDPEDTIKAIKQLKYGPS